VNRRLFLLPLIAAGVLATALAAMPATAGAAGAPSYDCSGGSIPGGNYRSVSVSGVCAVDAGNVSVQHNLIVRPGALLIAAFGGSDLSVGGNLIVQSDAAIALGCEPAAFTCANDPDQSEGGGTLSTHHTIGGNLVSTGALAVIVHASSIDGNAVIIGGGGGANCDLRDALQGGPAYTVFEDNTIGHNALIAGLTTCWLGFIRNTVYGNVAFLGNNTADPDGNEVVTNTISRNLICVGNTPAPQIGDSEGAENTAHHKIGQCANLAPGNPGGPEED